jgi:hypothetical protein
MIIRVTILNNYKLTKINIANTSTNIYIIKYNNKLIPINNSTVANNNINN